MGLVLDVDRCEIRYNSEWFGALSAGDLLAVAAHYTIARMLERDDFALRMGKGLPISLLEMMYPLVQGYDSVAVRADVELGGTDQLFNLLVGRDLQRAYGQEPQVVLTLPLLVGLDGKEKMSKSLGNYVGLTDPPGEMFGKLMSLPDAQMPAYHQLLLGWSAEQVQGLLAVGAAHPRERKADLAEQVTRLYHGEAAAREARAEFDRVFSAHELPSEMPVVQIRAFERDGEGLWIVDLLTRAGLAPSNTEARRLIRQGAVRLGEETLRDENARLRLLGGEVLQVGKRRFARVEAVED